MYSKMNVGVIEGNRGTRYWELWCQGKLKIDIEGAYTFQSPPRVKRRGVKISGGLVLNWSQLFKMESALSAQAHNRCSMLSS